MLLVTVLNVGLAIGAYDVLVPAARSLGSWLPKVLVVLNSGKATLSFRGVLLSPLSCIRKEVMQWWFVRIGNSIRVRLKFRLALNVAI